MKTITIENKEYQLEFTFAAAEHKELMQKMFNIVSGAYLIKHIGRRKKDEETVGVAAEGLIDGTSEMVSEIPHICITAFFAGLLENNPVSETDAKSLMKTYMKENKISFDKLFEELKQCMEDDGFFDLSGLTDMTNRMNKGMKEQKNQPKKNTKK